jgi:superfamily II DNA or RNA helicase
MPPGFVILIVAPLIHLVDQWIEVAAAFGLRPIRCAQGWDHWFDELGVAIQAVNSGHRPLLSLVTTASTLASDPFQRLLETVRRPLLLIGDEVHTYGAEGTYRTLPQVDCYRVGLSATPERWRDPAGTDRLERYFGPIVYRYTLRDALKDEVLTPYRYFPHLLALDSDELETFMELSRQIARLLGNDEDGAPNEFAKLLLIKRARLVGTARAKLPSLRKLLETRTHESHILVYCGDGTVEGPDGDEMVRQVEEAVRMIGADLGMTCASYTATTPAAARQSHLKDFAAGDLQVLVAIRCLDEGVDVPATRSAFILASSTNPRQFVQRRGRVLRKFPGKSRADLHDFFVVPEPSEFPKGSTEFRMMRNLVRGQLARSQEFTDLAVNGPEAAALLRPFRDHFELLMEG